MAVEFANRLSRIAFATLSLRGVLHGHDFVACVWSALLGLPVFFALGLLLGELARRVVEESVETQLAELLQADASAEEQQSG